jgi:hypothetical protein
MKTYLFQLLAVLSCFLASCSFDSAKNDALDTEPCNDKTLPFQYSIIITDKGGLVLLDANLLEIEYDVLYSKKNIKMFSYPEGSSAEPVYSIQKYEQESRIVVETEFNECKQEHVTMILELNQMWCACGPDSHLEHIYTYDTIRCDLRVLNDSVICEKISVNEILSWKNDGKKQEEPCITLVKDRHSITVMGLLNTPSPDI